MQEFLLFVGKASPQEAQSPDDCHVAQTVSPGSTSANSTTTSNRNFSNIESMFTSTDRTMEKSPTSLLLALQTDNTVVGNNSPQTNLRRRSPRLNPQDVPSPTEGRILPPAKNGELQNM